MRVAVVSTLTLFGAFAVFAAPPSKAVDFTRDVRPILSDKCFQCHGPDDKSRMANMRLDTREGAFAQRKNYSIIKPGDSANSRLVQRITHEKKALRMPPPQSALTLSDREIETLRRWIDEGAKWETHWAYLPPKRPDEPAVRNTKWARNPIDRFVLARLEKEGLKPAAEADRATLIRRVNLDLTGLPPAPAEIDAFLKDRSPDAYEKVVDRLLASPQYGERMAMHWLDLARYADTHGYHIDSHRDMWPWRDWVIRAFNRNMPWNQFTIEQLAGDLLPKATVDQKIASGFNRNHMINYEGGAIPEEYLNEYIVDRVDATSTVFLGMTVGCARCHDHKYDPIKQREYYSMYAFFNSVAEKGLDGRTGNAEPILQLPNDEQKEELDGLKAAIKARDKQLSDGYVDSLIAAWEPAAKLPPEPRAGIVAHYEFDGSLSDLSGRYQHGRVVKGEVGYGTAVVGNGASFNGEAAVDFGDIIPSAPVTLAVWLRSGGVNDMPVLDRGAAWSISAGSSIPLPDLNRGGYLYFTRNGQTLRTASRVYGKNWVHVVWSGDRVWIDGEPHELIPSTSPVEATSKTLAIPRSFKGSIDDLRMYDRALDVAELKALAIHQPARVILLTQADKRSKEAKKALREYFLKYSAPEYETKLFAELTDLRLRLKKLNTAIPSVMVMKESDKPRQAHVLARGDYRNLGEKVSAGVPAVLPPLPKDAPANRLTFARWLTDPSHPLMSRVTVNRFWAMYFGMGLVKTVEDFGSQGELPSHPELLDWLATEFMSNGWDVKALHRLIVTSATYRQASQASPALRERDPENRLLARGPRFRLPAEMIRDTALSVSGLLNPAIGGRSVYTYSPKGLWEDIAFGDVYSSQVYPELEKEGLHRRSMYTFWKRTAPPATLATFDAPDREKCVARRSVTNTPLQALALMNDPTFVEAAQMLAERMLKQGGTDRARRLRYGFRLVTGREPAAREITVLQKLVREDKLENWKLAASAMLNLDEAITKE